MHKWIGFFILIFFLSVCPQSAYAYVSGGAGTLTISPITTTVQTGTPFSLDVLFNTKGTFVSAISFRITIPVSSGDVAVTSVVPGDQMSAWNFPVKQIQTSGGNILIDVMALNSSPTGESTSTDKKIVTLQMSATQAFSGRAVVFDQNQSKMLRKSDAGDILGVAASANLVVQGQSIPPTTTPTNTPLPTASPTPGTVTDRPTTCDSSCDMAKGCGGNVTCVSANGVLRCRNASCPGVANCSCPKVPTPTTKKSGFSTIVATRTPAPTSTTAPISLISDAILTPMPTLAPLEPTLTVDSFYDAGKNAKPTFLVSGISDPNAGISLEITPDIIMKTTTADSSGSWSVQVSSPLKSGEKSMIVTATNTSGGKTVKTVTFSVAGGTSFVNITILFMVLAAIGVIGYMVYRKKQKQLAHSPAVSTTVPSTTSVPPSEPPQKPSPPPSQAP